MSEDKLSHYDEAGTARMVDVSSKSTTTRTARAHAFVRMSAKVLEQLDRNPKGNPPLPLAHVDIDMTTTAEGVRIESRVSTAGPTGVEMEALTAASIAALTIYDMTKALDKAIEIADVYLLEKTGGKSGDFRRP
jgi:cyclic pyranopterin monophosphate synthase